MKEHIPSAYNTNVFINCPFDEAYTPLFHAMIFAIAACGFTPRCAKEEDDSGDIRIKKIMAIIGECKYGVHDVSRFTGSTDLPRFNMPLELGIFMGCVEFGNAPHSVKRYLVVDEKPFRYQQFISDLSGQDTKSHGNSEEGMIRCIREWLGAKVRTRTLPHPSKLNEQYQEFLTELPTLCVASDWTISELSFNEYSSLVSFWLV
jgi:hypothetical protein